jgi:hypothetical protein
MEGEEGNYMYEYNRNFGLGYSACSACSQYLQVKSISTSVSTRNLHGAFSFLTFRNRSKTRKEAFCK